MLKSVRLARAATLFAALVVSACLAPAADPVTVKAGGYADLSIKVPDGSKVIWRFSAPPLQKSTDLPAGRIIFGGKAGTTYTVTALLVDFKSQDISEQEFVYIFEGTIAPPVVDPPVKPPVIIPTTLYFLVVRADGPAAPEFTKVMSLPAWMDLRAAGHSYKDKTVTEAKALGVTLPAGSPLPCVVTLAVTPSGSEIVRGPIALPTTADAIAKLPILK